MKTDDWFDQKDEVIELREEETLGVRDVRIIRDINSKSFGYRVRISIGEYMYFDSPTVNAKLAECILGNIKRRLQ